jgi:cytochrome c nitrite reductase small subunit
MSLFVFLLLGLPLGTSFYTFYYANGFSYLSNNPQACTNCHIMQDQYNSWSKSGHHHVAVCNDCHAPADIVGKYLTKMTNGYHHSLAFTTGNFSDPIRIKPHNKQIALNSCLRCHENILSKTNHQNKDCLHCHRDVAHPQ